MNKKLIFLLTVFVVATASSSFAGTPVVYNGCKNVATGIIRLIPSNLPAPLGTQCNTTATDPMLKETSVSWDQIGPIGPQGPQGLQGPQGNTGPAGPQGASGPQGSQGPAGAQGPQGATGATGAAGATGPKGDTGLTGAQGAAGANGTNGTNGTNGSTIWNGSGAPSNTLGSNGDFYMDTTNHIIYGPMASGVWPTTGTPLVGPAGPAGAQGPQGSQGPQGATGAPGTTTSVIFYASIGGIINADGTTTGTGYTVVHTAPGNYVINFLLPFSTVPLCFTSIPFACDDLNDLNCLVTTTPTLKNVTITNFMNCNAGQCNISYTGYQDSPNAFAFACVEQ
jgi:hypothetical protein